VPRRVLLVVGGGIGAFKALECARLLMDAGHEVEIVATEAALEFVGRASFAAIAQRPVVDALFGREPSVHTRLAAWADLVVVYPATADLMAKLAVGIADDAALVTLLASAAPRLVVPAMHTQMWLAASTQRSAAVLRADGARILGPTEGRLAGGDRGLGRLLDPAWVETWVTLVAAHPELRLDGTRVLVSAGGTREPIDPVRFVSNRSSGRQGRAVAAVAAAAGAEVTLVTTQDPGWVGEWVLVERVERAQDLLEAMRAHQDGADVIVQAAAVADFAPDAAAQTKLKRKGQQRLVLELAATEDVLANLVAHRREDQVIVGFAAETGDPRSEVARKLAERGVDIMVGNDVSRPDAGFDVPTNAVVMADRRGRWVEVGLAPKAQVAADILAFVASYAFAGGAH